MNKIDQLQSSLLYAIEYHENEERKAENKNDNTGMLLHRGKKDGLKNALAFMKLLEII